MINFKRILQPTPIKNEKDVTYKLPSLPRNEVISLLEKGELIGGVIGLENYKYQNQEIHTLFVPPFFKTKWNPCERESLFISPSDKETTFIQLKLSKSTMFPVKMDSVESLWDILTSITPKDIMLGYQVLLSYRQDNWKDNIVDQYEQYLQGIEHPSSREWVRRLQFSMNEKINQIVKYEYNHAPIEEVEQKLKEHGYRYSIRIILSGKSKKDRMKIVHKLKEQLSSLSYVNEWIIDTPLLVGDIIDNILKRKFDNKNKRDVLTVSELIPYLVSEPVIHIEKESTVKEEKIQNTTTQVNEFNVDNPIQLLPKGNNDESNDVNVEDIAKRFSKALKKIKDIKSELVAKYSIVGATLVRITFNLPKGLKYSDINKKSVIEDIQVYAGFRNLAIEQGDNQGEFIVSIPLEERRKIYLGDFISDEFREFSEKHPLPFIVGVDMQGKPLYRCLSEGRHLLIGAESGGGKSNFINQLLLTLMLMKKPTELQLFLIDPKMVEFSAFTSYPHVQKIVIDAEEGIELLSSVVNEMHKRYQLFKDAEVKNLISYNLKYPKKQLPHIVVAIDEYSELSSQNKKVHDYVISLSQLARASGICLILSTQDPRKEVIPPLVKSNMPSKVAFKCSNEYSYLTFLNKKPPRLYGFGHGAMAFANQSEEFIQFQSCLINDGDDTEIIKEIANQMKYDKFYYEIPDVEIVEEISDINRLINTILERGELRVSKLREILKVNINKLNSLMKELVSLGILLEPESRSKGYQLAEDYQIKLEEWRNGR